MFPKLKESDWKIFHKRKPEWREQYLREKNRDILLILTDEEKTPTQRFWDAKKKMEEEAEILRVCLDPHARSKMFSQLSFMYGYGLIHDSDFTEFSKELQEWLLLIRELDEDEERVRI